MNSHDHFWHGQLDLSKIGIVGHSMGGTTAALATQEEPRILAGVNLDGSTYPGMNADVRPIPVHKPFLFLATEEHASGESRAREYVGSESNTYYVVVTGADHMSFTDAHLVSSRFTRDVKPDHSAFERALITSTYTRSLVEEFLAKYLKAGVAPDLDLSVRVGKSSKSFGGRNVSRETSNPWEHEISRENDFRHGLLGHSYSARMVG